MPDDLLTKESVLTAARRLSVADRIDLFVALRDDLREDAPGVADEAGPAADELSGEQLAELDRRMARHHADPTAAIPWEQIEREVAEKYGAES